MTINRLDTTTVVLPFEHNVEEFINSLIMISNAENTYLVYCDVGKVVGMYKSAKELYSVLLNVLMTESITGRNLEEVEQALDNFNRDRVD